MLDEPSLDRLVELARGLPAEDVNRLAVASGAGQAALVALRADVGAQRLRTACSALVDLLAGGAAPVEVGAALLGAARATAWHHREQSLEVVWTGPASSVDTSRLTAAALAGLLAQARREVLLVGYAVHTEPAVAAELHAAADRDVEITLLLEPHADNPGFAGVGVPFPGLAARRLAWPGGQRPAGASLHAKVLVVDRRLALVGSANVTGAGLDRNLECGLLVRGGPAPRAIHDHVDALAAAGQLRVAPG